MSKCWGELMGIFLYLIMTAILLTGLISQLNDGKPMTCLIEFGIAIFIDCLK
jgi:cytochrome b561